MAKYDVTHACGCTHTHQIIGPHKERDKRIASLEMQKCADCWQAEKEEDARKTAEANAAKGLVALEGSPKQIAWAETIRAKKLAEIDKLGTSGTCTEAFFKVADYIKSIAEAKYWIDNRDCSVQYLMTQIATATAI